MKFRYRLTFVVQLVFFAVSVAVFVLLAVLDLFILAGLALIVIIIIGYAVTYRLLIGPLTRLTRSITLLSEDTSQKIYGTTRLDEIGDLARAVQGVQRSMGNVNEMVYSLMVERDHQMVLMSTIDEVTFALLAIPDEEDEQFSHSLQFGIATIAACVNADRIFVWKNEIVDGEDGYVAQMLWEQGNFDQVECMAQHRYRYSQIPGWKELFENGEVINRPFDDMEGAEKNTLNDGVKSLLVIPVYMQGYYWGMVSFGDYKESRYFTQDQVNLMRSATMMIVSAFNRQKQARLISEANERTKDLLAAAQAASRAKGEFLSTMSHEIRTPMNAILGMTKIGRDAAEINRKDYAFDRIQSASNHLLGVINDVLDMSKIESGKLVLSNEPFALATAFWQVQNIMSFRLDEKNHRYTSLIDPDIPLALVGDDQRLTQVLTNLLSNAVKFTPEGKAIRMEAHLIKKMGETVNLRFEVHDEGIGISAEQQERLFQPFVQAEASTTRRYGGSGLGLAISKHIIELMGGEIWVESDLGHGATFCFTVQLATADKEEAAAMASEHKSPETYEEFPSYAGKRIILAEDININQEIVLAALEPMGITIDVASNGSEALTLFEAAPEAYDLIFMDVQMPIMDGHEATRKIRAMPFAQAQRIPIIAMTANVFAEDISKCHESGMNSHLGKPLNFEDMMATLKQYFTP